MGARCIGIRAIERGMKPPRIPVRGIERGMKPPRIPVRGIERGMKAPRIPIRGIELLRPLICAVVGEAAKTHATT